MIDIEKLNSAKMWIEKLANGINPLNDELVKDDDLINNVHISRCLFYVAELLGEINTGTKVERRGRKAFFLSTTDAVNIPVSAPNGIANFTRLVNSYIPADMKPLTAVQVIKWLRNDGYMQEVMKDNTHKTNLPTEKGNSIGITTEVQRNPEGMEYQRVVYSVDAQRFILNNIEAIAALHQRTKVAKIKEFADNQSKTVISGSQSTGDAAIVEVAKYYATNFTGEIFTGDSGLKNYEYKIEGGKKKLRRERGKK